MRVRLKVDISGSRGGPDGPTEWPPRGSIVDLPDQEGADLCAAGMADPMTDFVKAETATLPEPEQRTANAAEVVSSETSEAPSAEEAGRAAAVAGQPRSANPYDGRSTAGKMWFKGWDSVQ